MNPQTLGPCVRVSKGLLRATLSVSFPCKLTLHAVFLGHISVIQVLMRTGGCRGRGPVCLSGGALRQQKVLESSLKWPLDLPLGRNSWGVSPGAPGWEGVLRRHLETSTHPSLFPQPVWGHWGRASTAGNSQKNSFECKKVTKPQGNPWEPAWVSGCVGAGKGLGPAGLCLGGGGG